MERVQRPQFHFQQVVIYRMIVRNGRMYYDRTTEITEDISMAGHYLSTKNQPTDLVKRLQLASNLDAFVIGPLS